MGILLIVVIALALCAYVAIPLLVRGQADPLPNPRDSVEQDLEDERDALLRAIEELELRTDLQEDRRTELKARYEAKAAGVLRALDERRGALAGRSAPTPRPARRLPAAALLLLGLMVLSGSVLGGFVLPRVGEGTVTISGGELEAARALRTLQQAVEKDPNAENLMELADAYWHQRNIGDAKATYLRVANEVSPVPARAYRRLAQLTIREDLDQARRYLEQAREADPEDLATLRILGGMYFAANQVDQAIEAWEDFLAAPGGAGNETVQAQLQVARELRPLALAVRDDPSEDNLLAYAGALWEREERERAVGVYLRVLAEQNPEQPVALSRIGQMLFFSGRTGNAIAALERARQADGENLDTLLFLGNAYFSAARYEDAIGVWEAYVTASGGPEEAGRVPDLIQNARARLANQPSEPAARAGAPAVGEAIFEAHCAACHGADGRGGAGPRLAGNPRLTDIDYVAGTILRGRGMMPGFRGRLSQGELQALIGYLQRSFVPAEGVTGQ